MVPASLSCAWQEEATKLPLPIPATVVANKTIPEPSPLRNMYAVAEALRNTKINKDMRGGWVAWPPKVFKLARIGACIHETTDTNITSNTNTGRIKLTKRHEAMLDLQPT